MVAVADDVLDTTCDLDEERVAHVQHDEPDRVSELLIDFFRG